jgi:hypothetical protein
VQRSASPLEPLRNDRVLHAAARTTMVGCPLEGGPRVIRSGTWLPIDLWPQDVQDRRQPPAERLKIQSHRAGKPFRCAFRRSKFTDGVSFALQIRNHVLKNSPGLKACPASRIRAASFRDYAQIASLEARFGLEPKDYEDWSHLWLGNPHFRELERDWDIGWVVENEDKRIVASVGNIPLAYEFEGKRIRAASGRALVAEPEYRSAALLLLDRLIHQPGVGLYVNNTIGPQSAASFSGFGCSRVPVGVWDRAAFWIARYRDFFERLLAGLDYPLAKPLSLPLSAAAFLRDGIGRRLRPRDVEVQGCPEFDDRFQSFWEDLKRDYPRLLLADRSCQTLNWHFKFAARNHRLYVPAVVDGRRLAAYAIFDRRDSPRFGLKRLRLVDFQSRDGSNLLLSSLLAWALRKCAAEGIHVVEITGRWLEQGEWPGTIIPYSRPLSTWTYFYRANSQELDASLKDRRTWVPSLLDGDASL